MTQVICAGHIANSIILNSNTHTLLPVPCPFLIIICPRPSTPTRVSEPKGNLSESSELAISAEDISSEAESHVLGEEP